MDIHNYVKENQFKGLTNKALVSRLILQEPVYHGNVHQQRHPLRTKKDRPTLASTLGNYQCDIGFFSIEREFETPKMFQYGFLIAKDSLSRYTFFILMRGPRSKENLVKVFQRLITKHNKAHTYPIISISFDLERAVISKTFQSFLESKDIAFRTFSNSRSKAFFAENGIKLLRVDMDRYLTAYPNQRWWKILETEMETNFNSKEIFISNKPTGYKPKDINMSNVDLFIQKVQEIVPAARFGLHTISNKYTLFKYEIGSRVQPKLVVVDSSVLGEKRSRKTLSDQVFIIDMQVSVLHKDLVVRPGYLCKNERNTNQEELFDEQDIVLAN